MTNHSDYRIPILLAVPICFAFWWMVADSGLFARSGQGTDDGKVVASFFKPETPHNKALRSVFLLNKIPVNSAGSELLQTISGIGPKLAQRIISEREQGGPFASSAELSRVRGIGPKRIIQFQESLNFD